MTEPSWWTSARVDELRARWNAGESGRDIWLAMGAPSRNAVVGKANRLGLLNNTDKKRPPGPRVKRLRGPGRPRTRPPTPVKPPPMLTTGSTPRLIWQLAAGDCRMPIAGSGLETLFCAAPALPKQSYCAFHDRMAHALYTPRRQ